MTLVFGVESDGGPGDQPAVFSCPPPPWAASGTGQNGLLDKAVLRCTVPGRWPQPPGLAATALDVTLLRRPFGLFLLAAAVPTLRQK